MPAVVVAESPRLTAEYFADGSAAGAAAVIAASAEAACLLRALRVPHLTPDDLLPPQEFMTLMWPAMRRQAEACNEIDLRLDEAGFGSGDHGFAWAFLHPIKVLSDVLLIRALWLRRAVQRFGADRLVCLCHGEPELNDLFLRSSPLAPLVSAAGARLGAAVEVRTEPADTSGPAAPASAPPRRWLQRAADALEAWRRWRWASGPSRHLIVTFTFGYDVRGAIRELAGRCRIVDIERWISPSAAAAARAQGQIDAVRRLIAGSAAYRSLWSVDGLEYSSAAEGLLDAWVRQWPGYVGLNAGAGEALVRRPPDAFLAPHLCSWRTRSIRALAQRRGVPFVVYQHGGHPGYCDHPLWPHADGQADLNLLYGEGGAHYCRSHPPVAEVARTRCVAVGSSRLDALAITLARARPSAPATAAPRRRALFVAYLHTPQHKYLDGACIPDVPQMDLERGVAETFAAAEDAELVWRPFPSGTPAPSLEFVRGCRNVRIDPVTPMAALLASADLIVLGYWSTPLLEALVTHAPIVVFAPPEMVAMFDDARAMLRRRAYVAESGEALLRACRDWFGGAAAWDTDVHDRAFLRRYGNHLDDGRSAERAADEILRLCAARHDRRA